MKATKPRIAIRNLLNTGRACSSKQSAGASGVSSDSAGATGDWRQHRAAQRYHLSRFGIRCRGNIESLVGRPVTVIGHDFGNRIARTLASDHPRLVKRLILLSAGGMVPRSPEMEKLTTRFWESALSQEDRLTAIRQIFFATGNRLPRTWEEGWYFEVARAQRASDARTSLKEWWAGGSAPMLVVQGTEDVVAPPENAKRLAAEFPERVTFVEIPHAGHALLPEQPEQVEKAILAYLQR